MKNDSCGQPVNDPLLTGNKHRLRGVCVCFVRAVRMMFEQTLVQRCSPPAQNGTQREKDRNRPKRKQEKNGCVALASFSRCSASAEELARIKTVVAASTFFLLLTRRHTYVQREKEGVGVGVEKDSYDCRFK